MNIAVYKINSGENFEQLYCLVLTRDRKKVILHPKLDCLNCIKLIFHQTSIHTKICCMEGTILYTEFFQHRKLKCIQEF